MYIADLHIHSRFSLATSKQLVPEYLDLWARNKGITLVGTGDFTHPSWLAELEEKLVPDGNGLYRLKEEYRLPCHVPDSPDPRFILTAEISNIYKKGGKTRKVHNVLFVNSFQEARAIQHELQHRSFNITSDGRPILGMDSRDLLELCLEQSKSLFFVPAHIWTPWFSALGEKSGFDSIHECYGDLTSHIHAVETGLSTDPAMNRMCSFLDNFTLLSNSDAHSPEKLGRNANIVLGDLSYSGLTESIIKGTPDVWGGTIDMFPQEGKYHYAGHRKCGVCWNPLQTEEHRGICPVCGKKVVYGVMNRIAELADRKAPQEKDLPAPFFSVIALKEIIGEIMKVKPASKKVDAEYHKLIHHLGPELEILMHRDIQDISAVGGSLLGEGIRRMRNKEIYISEGFDGQYGEIKVFTSHDLNDTSYTASLFKPAAQQETSPQRRETLNFNVEEYLQLRKTNSSQNILSEQGEKIFSNGTPLSGLNPMQKNAAAHGKNPAIVIAGPGTGKTRVLTQRVANLIHEKIARPEEILALTFTNKAAKEMRQRLEDLPEKEKAEKPQIDTFHAFGLKWLRNNNLQHSGIIDDQDKSVILKKLAPEIQRRDHIRLFRKFSNIKTTGIPDPAENVMELYLKYEDYLQNHDLLDFDDLLVRPVREMRKHAPLLEKTRNQYRWILVDECQDMNGIQYEMLKMLAPGKDSNVFLIGDPNQSIYGFRGADRDLLQDFITAYEPERYHLTTSYRCSEKIVKASGDILEAEKPILAGVNPGVKLHIVRNESGASEAEYVARKIEEMMGGLRFFSMDSSVSSGQKYENIDSLSDFAVLCRTSRQMEAFEKAFNDHSIPFQRTGEEPWIKAEPFKSIIYILKDIYLPENPVVKEFLQEKEIQYPPNLEKENNPEFIIRNLAKQLKTDVTWYHMERIIKEMKAYDTVEDFLEAVMLGVPADYHIDKAEKVSLMTIHASKGLEFRCVFVAGLEDGLLPYSLFESRVADVKEEERLLYVAMTRSREYLFLTHATRRVLTGRTYALPRSHFLHRIDNELVKREKQEHKKKPKKDDSQLALF